MLFVVCARIMANPLVYNIVTVQDHDIFRQKIILCEIMYFDHLHNSSFSALIDTHQFSKIIQEAVARFWTEKP